MGRPPQSSTYLSSRSTVETPHPHAGTAGAFYLLTIILGTAAFVLYGKVVVSGNPQATAANLLLHPAAFRASAVCNLLAGICYIVVTALFYFLFKPVSRSASLTAAFLSLIGSGMGAVSCASQLIPLSLLRTVPYTDVFRPEELNGLVLLFLRVSAIAYEISLVFFGFYCLLIGYLIFRSGFLPKVIGVLMALAGAGWLTNLWPPLSQYLSYMTMLTGLAGEGSLTVWLLLKGVNETRWLQSVSRHEGVL
jgi:hypothetical protein